jgi:uncharacterized membrane protein
MIMGEAYWGGKAAAGGWLGAVLWVLALLTVALALGSQFVLGAGAGMAIPLLLVFPFAILHGVRRYGAVGTLLFFVVAYVVSNAFENLSIITGFPFGNYHYTGANKLFYVPVAIGVIYFGLGYVCWMVANTLLDKADMNLDWRRGWSSRLNTFALPLLAGAVMTMWDVSTDHWASTVRNTWVWEDGGGLFGVPYSNYIGWWFVTWSFFQIFSLYLAWKQSNTADLARVEARGELLPNVLIYGSLGLQFGLYQLAGPAVSGTAVDAIGQVWNKADMFETMAILSTFTMIPVALLALVKIWRRDVNER